MRALRLLGLLLDLLLLVANVVTGGPMAEGVRVVLVVVAALLGAVVLVVVVLFAVAVVGTLRQPPYQF